MEPDILCTAVEYDIPVVWAVRNNLGWVSIRDIRLGLFRGHERGTMFHQGSNKRPVFGQHFFPMRRW
jgi:acetolactate synthase I/II/III large subunit